MDIQMKPHAKGMEQTNKTLATILEKILNPNVLIPKSFGVGFSTLSHDDLIHNSPVVASRNTLTINSSTRHTPVIPKNVGNGLL